jgi:hypothetical protein
MLLFPEQPPCYLFCYLFIAWAASTLNSFYSDFSYILFEIFYFLCCLFSLLFLRRFSYSSGSYHLSFSLMNFFFQKSKHKYDILTTLALLDTPSQKVMLIML